MCEQMTVGLKSHDCRIFLQCILLVDIYEYLTRELNTTLIEWGAFFKDLYARTLNVEGLKHMKWEITIILYKLESIFPRSFVNIVVHLAVYLSHEAQLTGLV